MNAFIFGVEYFKYAKSSRLEMTWLSGIDHARVKRGALYCFGGGQIGYHTTY